MILYRVIDIFFLVFHTGLILFNLFGWLWKKTRVLNLITLLLTGASWFLLGIFYGIGYCPFTEWHFRVLEILGRRGLPASYTQYLAERLTGISFSPELVNALTMGGFLLALICSVGMNIKDRRKG